MDNATPERWLPVVGYEGLYEVSDLGRVRSLARFGVRKTRILKGSPNNQGYLHLDLCRDGKKIKKKIHGLVCEAFVGPRPSPELDIRHLNGNPADNCLTNLTYGTKSENGLDRVRHGTHNMARKTHCPQGHAYDYRYSNGKRGCSRCIGRPANAS